MGATAVIVPQDTPKPCEVFEFTGLPNEVDHAAVKQLSPSANDLIRSVAAIVDDMIVRTLKARSAEGFVKERTEIFPRYYAAMLSLGALMRMTIPGPEFERIIAQSLCELEADFRDNGAATIGKELSDRGIFTVWVLRKMADLAQRFDKPLAGEVAEADGQIAKKFGVNGMWARFHIDCLVKSMDSKNACPIYPEVREPITDGLRAVVDAYAWLRQAADLRIKSTEPELPPIPWDEEDEALLSDSMRDLGQNG